MGDSGKTDLVVSPNTAKFEAELEALMRRMPSDAVFVAPSRDGALPSGDAAVEAAAGDSEWAQFPRTTDWLPHGVKANAAAISASSLFRNTHLNPTDVYIDAANRQRIAGMIEALAPIVAQLQNLEGRATMEEVEIAVGQGLCVEGSAEAVTWERLPAGIQRQVAEQYERNREAYAALGATTPQGLNVTRIPMVETNDFIRKLSGGKVYFVPVRALRTTSACRSFRRFLYADLGLRLLSAFTSLGLTPDVTAAKIVEQISLNS